ncbi:MAG: HPr family phosphocarrier protein [Clostridia bacterium]|nr:HPr family phosphocarrier protein [Clostridia bacterium]MBR2926333.1 HPr family phosphocarrier protein [Clostridia bacterium]
MKQFQCPVRDENGMHARPAGALSNLAKQFSSEVRVRCGQRDANAKRLISLMSLGAKAGEVLEFEIVGEDEEAASDAILKLLAQNDGERASEGRV